VGSNNYFGIRATVLPDMVVGDDCVIQAGMILDRNVKSKSTVYYRFKERIQVLASSLD
jgi:tetrahydrodipicolinate N-succinyltransferase